MHQWIVLLHIVGAFIFVLAHGASIVMAMQVSRERDPRRIAVLLELSSAAIGPAYIGLLLLLVGGIWAAIDGGFFARGWPWAALGLLIAITIAMYAIATRFYRQLRDAVGMARPGANAGPPPAALSDAEIIALAGKSPVMPLVAIGFGGLLIILWLMVLKPF